MTADILDAVVTYLNAHAPPVYYPPIPASVPRDVSALPQFAVVTAGGPAPSQGNASYMKVQRLRCDLRCYGSTLYFAMQTYRALEQLLKELVPVNVDVGPVSARVGVRLHNAIHSAGPVQMIEPETNWPLVTATWNVHGSEVEVGATIVPADVVIV